MRPALKAAGFLTRDSRVVERKKFGRAKARKSFQFFQALIRGSPLRHATGRPLGRPFAFWFGPLRPIRAVVRVAAAGRPYSGEDEDAGGARLTASPAASSWRAWRAPPLLQLTDISLTFGGEPVFFSDLSLVVQEGDRLALVGAQRVGQIHADEGHGGAGDA